MIYEGPQIDKLIHRLSECPPEFLAEPMIASKGQVDVSAVVHDLILDLGGNHLSRQDLSIFSPSSSKTNRNWLMTIMIACWLYHDRWFLARNEFADLAFNFLRKGLIELASLIPADQFIQDPDHREELVRLSLSALNLRPAGETIAQAQDRLSSLDSRERQRVILAAQSAEERNRQILAAMAAKAAEEAAAKYNRE